MRYLLAYIFEFLSQILDILALMLRRSVKEKPSDLDSFDIAMNMKRKGIVLKKQFRARGDKCM
jgi:hypothetical protein